VNPHFALFLAVFLWAGTWIVARPMVLEATPLALSFWRWAVAIAVLAPIALPDLLREWPAIRRAWRPILFFGTCGTVLYNTVGYVGLQDSSATNAVVIQSLIPAWIPLFAWLLFRERLRAVTAAGLLLACAGALAIVTQLDPKRLAMLQGNPGDIWLILNTAMWGLYTAGLRWKPKDIGSLAFMLAVMLAGMITGLPAYLVEVAAGGTTRASWPLVLGILYLGGCASVVGYVLWSKGVALLGPAKAGAYLYLIPPLGAAMAILFLGESLHLYHLAGLALILPGVWLATRGVPALHAT
jgi:drug/metabolite transporter (DMT)-like permease